MCKSWNAPGWICFIACPATFHSATCADLSTPAIRTAGCSETVYQYTVWLPTALSVMQSAEVPRLKLLCSDTPMVGCRGVQMVTHNTHACTSQPAADKRPTSLWLQGSLHCCHNDAGGERAKVEAFQAFWEAGSPLLGDEGALGWANWESNQTCTPGKAANASTTVTGTSGTNFVLLIPCHKQCLVLTRQRRALAI